MRIVIFTSNAVRHKYVANTLAAHADEALAIIECKDNDAREAESLANQTLTSLQEHFLLRYKTEKEFFPGNDILRMSVLPIIWKEASLNIVYQAVKDFNPDAVFVFGASILKERLISLIPPGRFINMHLGLSPYYRGSGTNFWPFVNDELEYVGSTILHLDAGIDTGDIIAHVRPEIEAGDNVHTVGNKVIRDSTMALVKIIEMLRTGKELHRTKQWDVPESRYYKSSDFNEEVLAKYKENLASGMIERYVKNPKKDIKILSL